MLVWICGYGDCSFDPGKPVVCLFGCGVASLTSQAHTHARNAVLETRKSNPVAASEEHDLAAGEFSTVGGSSTDHEVCAV